MGWHFEKYTYSLACQKLDEKINTPLVSGKYEAGASSRLSLNTKNGNRDYFLAVSQLLPLSLAVSIRLPGKSSQF